MYCSVLQLELEFTWTCGPPLSEAGGILQAGFSAVKCHYLGHMPQLKKTARSNAFSLAERRATCHPKLPSPLASCMGNFDSLLLMGRLCSLPFAAYFPMVFIWG